MGKITTKKRILFSFRGQVTINGQIMSEKPGIFCAQNGQKLWVFGQPEGGESTMPCTEAYREHIMYTFNGFCKTVIRFAAINAWRDRSRRRQKEISLEYLTEEKFYPLGTTDEYFEAPYEEHPITICGQTVILTNRELAAALLSLPEKNREIIFLYFFGHYTQQEIGEMYGRCRSTTGYQIRRTLQLLHKEMEVLSHGESEPFAL